MGTLIEEEFITHHRRVTSSLSTLLELSPGPGLSWVIRAIPLHELDTNHFSWLRAIDFDVKSRVPNLQHRRGRSAPDRLMWSVRDVGMQYRPHREGD